MTITLQYADKDELEAALYEASMNAEGNLSGMAIYLAAPSTQAAVRTLGSTEGYVSPGEAAFSIWDDRRDTMQPKELWDLVAQAAIDASTEAATADRVDAERYRWLRRHTTGQSDKRGRQEFALPDPHPLSNIMKGSVSQHLDAAIDAARSQAGQQVAKP